MAKQVIMKFNQDGALVQADSSAVGIRQGDSNGEVTFVAIFQGGRNDQCVAKLNFTRPDGKRIQNIVMQPSASSIDRFNYAAMSAWFFAVAGNASATVTITDASGAIAAQGAYTFAIEATDAEPADTTITYDEAAELEGIVAEVSAASLKRAHGLTIDEPTVSAFYSAVLGYYGESAILDGDRFSAEYQNSESSTTTFLGEFFGDDKFIVLVNTTATVDGETQYDRHMYLVVGDAVEPTITEFAAKAYVDAFFDQYGNALRAIADEDGLSIKNGYVKKSQIVDNLYTTASNQPLSAYQGSVLKGLIDQLSNYIYEGASNASIDRLAEVFAFLAGHDDDETLDGILAGKVSKTDIVDGLSTADPTKVLSANQGVALDARIAALEQSQGQLNDNYYTKAETNALLANKQNALTFDSEPTEGSANPVTSGGVFSAMGNVVAIANGKCKSYVMNRNINIAYLKGLLNEDYEGLKIVDAEGNDVSQAVWDGDYDNVNLSDVYDAFHRNDRKGFSIHSLSSNYILLASGGDSLYYNTTYILDRFFNLLDILNIGDTIYIIDVDVPDWWYSNREYFSVLETQKVDLTAYYTKLQADALLANKLALSFAGASHYDDTATYPLGATCTHDGKLYKRTAAGQNPEAWDATHWTEVTINDYAKLGSAQTFAAKQTFGGGIEIKRTASATDNFTFVYGTNSNELFLLYNNASRVILDVSGGICPYIDENANLGRSNKRYITAYIENISDGTNSASVAEIISTLNPTDTGATEIKWSKLLAFALSADATLTLETAKTGCLPEYKAKITNSHATDPIDITLPSGTTIVTNDDDITISSNVMTLPAQTTVELNIQDGHCIAYNWSAQ